MLSNLRADLDTCTKIRDEVIQLKTQIQQRAMNVSHKKAELELRLLTESLSELVHDYLDGGALFILEQEIENEITDDSPVISGMMTEDQRLDNPRHEAKN
jgi:hypothetical protein